MVEEKPPRRKRPGIIVPLALTLVGIGTFMLMATTALSAPVRDAPDPPEPPEVEAFEGDELGDWEEEFEENMAEFEEEMAEFEAEMAEFEARIEAWEHQAESGMLAALQRAGRIAVGVGLMAVGAFLLLRRGGDDTTPDPPASEPTPAV